MVTKPAPVTFTNGLTASKATHPELPGITAEFTWITPALASQWLDDAPKVRRSQRDRNIAAQTRDLTQGNWIFNGDTLVFDSDGRFIDGQHRLKAIAASGTAVWALVVRGVPPEAEKVIDTGAARTPADHLTLTGATYAPASAALARRIFLWEANNGEGGYATITPTHTEIATTYDKHPEIIDAIRFAYTARNQADELPAVRISVWSMAWWLFTRKDPGTGTWFLNRVLTGVADTTDSPVLAVRRFLLTTPRRRPAGGGERIGEKEQLAALIIGWNHYRAGETTARIELPRGGLKREFPRPY